MLPFSTQDHSRRYEEEREGMPTTHSEPGGQLAALQLVPVDHKSIGDYASIVGEERITEIETLATPLHGARVVHVSATARGGGVAEMLHALVPLMCSAGLQAEWRVMTGS